MRPLRLIVPQDTSPHASMRFCCSGLPARLHRRLPLPRTAFENTLRFALTSRWLCHYGYHNRVLLYAKSFVDLPSGREQVASR